MQFIARLLNEQTFSIAFWSSDFHDIVDTASWLISQSVRFAICFEPRANLYSISVILALSPTRTPKFRLLFVSWISSSSSFPSRSPRFIRSTRRIFFLSIFPTFVPRPTATRRIYLFIQAILIYPSDSGEKYYAIAAGDKGTTKPKQKERVDDTVERDEDEKRRAEKRRPR